MAVLNLVQAINQGLQQALAGDDRVLVFGEDVGADGGVFRATEGLFEQFGGERVFDTPLAESGIVGLAIGLAATVYDRWRRSSFSVHLSGDRSDFHSRRPHQSRSRGRYSCPLVIRTPTGRNQGSRAARRKQRSPLLSYAWPQSGRALDPDQRQRIVTGRHPGP